MAGLEPCDRSPSVSSLLFCRYSFSIFLFPWNAVGGISTIALLYNLISRRSEQCCRPQIVSIELNETFKDLSEGNPSPIPHVVNGGFCDASSHANELPDALKPTAYGENKSLQV